MVVAEEETPVVLEQVEGVPIVDLVEEKAAAEVLHAETMTNKSKAKKVKSNW